MVEGVSPGWGPTRGPSSHLSHRYAGRAWRGPAARNLRISFRPQEDGQRYHRRLRFPKLHLSYIADQRSGWREGTRTDSLLHRRTAVSHQAMLGTATQSPVPVSPGSPVPPAAPGVRLLCGAAGTSAGCLDACFKVTKTGGENKVGTVTYVFFP